MTDNTEKLNSIIYQLKRFNELNGADIRLVYETLEHYLEIKDISDTCPHCGCTEMLCGHNGSGCSKEEEE